ncbi:hypothetical protein ACE01N_16085 [Saccharicrinis sp. FJH2]|uniref:hypothetical protein n=1 Tax=Saccharicrinis sp. FJH65 TaxID=3344659 RepID=UPI0035F49209
MAKEIIRIIVFSLVSSFLIFASKNSYIINVLISKNILSANVKIENIQAIFFLIGITWAGLWLPFEHIIIKRLHRSKKELYVELVSYNKANYLKLLKEKTNQHSAEFLTRIFKPKHGLIGLWNRYLKGKISLHLCEIKGISDPFHHKTLHFSVYKNKVEGMVGKSYIDKALCVDFDLENNDYHLTESQKTKIGNLGFCSTIPIFNKVQSKVIAVLSIDCSEKLSFNESQKREWESHMTYYAAFIDKHIKL